MIIKYIFTVWGGVSRGIYNNNNNNNTYSGNLLYFNSYSHLLFQFLFFIFLNQIFFN